MSDMEVKKYKVLALFGKSGAGKDTIQNWIVSEYPNALHKIVSYTTRPKRDYEIEGRDYYYIDINEFTNRLLSHDLLEAVVFNNWGYGTSIQSLKEDKINVGVFNPEGIRTLMDDPRIDIMPIYIDCKDKTRLMRALSREDNIDCHELCRRFFADEKDFSDLEFDYLSYKNEDEDAYNWWDFLTFDFTLSEWITDLVEIG